MVAPQLLVSPLYKTGSTPLASKTQSNIGTDIEQPYVLNIVSLPAHYAIATSAPSNAINVLDKSSLQLVQSLGSFSSGSSLGKSKKQAPGAGAGRQAHEGGITGLKAYDYLLGERKSGLISCGRDGRVVLWDDRSPNGEGGVKMYAPSNGSKFRALLSCDISPDGMSVVGGTELQGDDALIVHWDPRNASAPLRTHSATHSDDITVLSYAPPGVTLKGSPATTPLGSDTKVLLSASSDGLLCLSNANEDDEDEAVLLTANWGCSIAQAGWIDGGSDKTRGVWAASDMETFGTWTGDLEPRLNFNIREPGVHGAQTWVTDYTVTSHPSTSQQQLQKQPLLSVFVGSNEGDFSLVSTKNPLSSKRTQAPWVLHQTWTHGHVGVVRSLLRDTRAGVIVSGGEDAKLQVWRDDTQFGEDSLYEDEGEDTSDSEMAMDQDGDDTMGVEASPARHLKRGYSVDSDGDHEMDTGEKDGKRRRH